MPPDDGEWSFCQSWTGPTTQEVEVSCGIRMLTADDAKPTDTMNRIVSSPKKYSFITRSPRIVRSKSMTREYIYFPIISSKSDNLSKSWLRNVKSLSSLQGKDEKQRLNEVLRNGKHLAFFPNLMSNNVPHSDQEYENTSPENLSHSCFQRNHLTASDRHIDSKRKIKKIKSNKKCLTLSSEEIYMDDAMDMENTAKAYELSDKLNENQTIPGNEIKSPNLRPWNPPSKRTPVLSSFKPDYNVLQPNSVVALSHQFERTPSPNKTPIVYKKKIEIFNRTEIKRRRIQTEPVLEKKKESDSSKSRANSLPDGNNGRKKNAAEISPKSVKKLRSNWEKKSEECSLTMSGSASHNRILLLNNQNGFTRLPSYEENFIQSARQIQVHKEYNQRVSTSVSNLKSQFENFKATPSPNFIERSENLASETSADKCVIPKIVTSSLKAIRSQFEQQSLNKKEDSGKLKPVRYLYPSKSPPILNLLARFDPSISCSSHGRDSTASNGSFSDNEVFACDENSRSRNDEMDNSDIFVSQLAEKKERIQVDGYLRQREKEKGEELKRLKEHRDREAIMAEKREVEKNKKMEEESEKKQREQEREQERTRIEAERELQRKRLEEEKKFEKLQRETVKENQRIAIEEEVKRAKKLREDELRKERKKREELELKRIEEEKEQEEFEREKLVEARELMEAELEKEKEEKLNKEEEKMKQIQIERGLLSEKDVVKGIAADADVDDLINKFEKTPKQVESDNESSPCSERKTLSRGGSTQSLSNCRPLNPDELQLFMGMTTTESFMRTQSLRVKSSKKKNSRQSRMKRSNSMSEKSSPILVPNKPRTSMGPPVSSKVPANCRHLRPEEWKFFLGDMTSSIDCDFNFSDSE